MDQQLNRPLDPPIVISGQAILLCFFSFFLIYCDNKMCNKALFMRPCRTGAGPGAAKLQAVVQR